MFMWYPHLLPTCNFKRVWEHCVECSSVDVHVLAAIRNFRVKCWWFYTILCDSMDYVFKMWNSHVHCNHTQMHTCTHTHIASVPAFGTAHDAVLLPLGEWEDMEQAKTDHEDHWLWDQEFTWWGTCMHTTSVVSFLLYLSVSHSLSYTLTISIYLYLYLSLSLPSFFCMMGWILLWTAVPIYMYVYMYARAYIISCTQGTSGAHYI